MRCRVNFKSDPISLTIIAADGKEHALLDAHEGHVIEAEIVTQHLSGATTFLLNAGRCQDCVEETSKTVQSNIRCT